MIFYGLQKLFVLLVFFSTCFSSGYLEDFYNEYHAAHFEVVEISKSREWEVIKKNLPKAAWPILPASHCIERQDNEWVVTRHRDSACVDLDFFTFGSDTANGINYVVQVDGQTTYSYAHTRNPSFQGNRTNHFPFSLGPVTYLDGHCIDHGDTPNEALKLYNQLSTDHAANHIPEPPNTYWGKTLRNQLVQEFRQQKKAYSQWVFYPDTLSKTHLGAYVPSGVLFMGHENTGTTVDGWSISWNDPIHGWSGQSRGVRTTLKDHAFNGLSQQYTGKNLLGVKGLSPHSFVYIKGHLDPHFAYALEATLAFNNPYDYFSLHRMEVLSGGEVLPVWSAKTINCVLPHILSTETKAFQTATYWMKRTLGYLEALQENDFTKDIVYADLQGLLPKIKQSQVFDEADCYYDHLRQIIAHDASINAVPEIDNGCDLRYLFGDYAMKTSKEIVIAPSAPVKVQIYQGKGSIQHLKTPLSPEKFHKPKSLELEMIGTDTGANTKKIKEFLNANRQLFENNPNIQEVRITGAVQALSTNAEKALEEVFGVGKVKK